MNIFMPILSMGIHLRQESVSHCNLPLDQIENAQIELYTLCPVQSWILRLPPRAGAVDVKNCKNKICEQKFL